MSSVGSSESRNKQDEQLRNAREEYKNREADLIKKHNREVRNLTEANRAEIERMRSINDARVADLQTASKEAITRRDAKYQREMDQMRKFHTKQLEGLMKDSDQKLRTQRKAADSQIKFTNMGKQDRLEELNKRYNQQLEENRSNYQTQIEKAREEQTRALDRFKQKSTARNEELRESQREYYQGRMMGLKNDLRTTRQNTTERLRNQEIRHSTDKMRMNDNFMDEVKRRDVSSNDIQAGQREAFQASLKDIRQKSRVAAEEDREQARYQHEQLKSSINDRVEGREKRLEKKISDLQNANARYRINTQKRANAEVDKWRDSYEEKFKILEDARQQAVENNNETNAKNIKHVRQEATEVIQANNRYMQGQLDLTTTKSKQALNAQKNEAKIREQYQRDTADARVHNIREETFEDMERLKENYERNLAQLKKGHEAEVRQLRLASQKQQDEKIQAMKLHIQETQAKHQRDMEDTVRKYEKQIADLNDQFTREKRLQGNREKQLTESMQRAAQADQDNLKLKFEEKHRQTLNQHNDEKRRMAVRHKEQVDNIMAQVRKT